jgi:hypothetical protein
MSDIQGQALLNDRFAIKVRRSHWKSAADTGWKGCCRPLWKASTDSPSG